MKQLLAFCLLILLSRGATAQDFQYQRDFPIMLAQSKDPNSSLFYDKLLPRFNANDTTLTDHEVLALLIGFTAKPQYKPYQDLGTERHLYDLNDEGNFKEGLKEGLEFISTHPFSVKALFEVAYAYHKLGQEDSAQFYLYKGHRIFATMLYSGKGVDPEKPTFALGPADGQDYIRKFVGVSITSMGSDRDKDGNFLDMLEVKFSEDRIVPLYFIIEHATKTMFSAEDMKRIENAVEKMGKEKKKKQ